MNKNCVICSKEMIGRSDAKTCSSKCRQINYRKAKKQGFVYLIKDKQRGLVKIGNSKEPEKRVSALCKTLGISDYIFKTFGLFNDCAGVELSCHKKFKEGRVCGEWFNADIDNVEKYLNDKLYEQEKLHITDDEKKIIEDFDRFKSQTYCALIIPPADDEDLYSLVSIVSRIYDEYFGKVSNNAIVKFANDLSDKMNLEVNFEGIADIAFAVFTLREKKNQLFNGQG